MLTPVLANLQAKEDMRGCSSHGSVLLLGDHSLSAMPGVRDHTLTSKFLSSTDSPQLAASPPRMSFCCSSFGTQPVWDAAKGSMAYISLPDHIHIQFTLQTWSSMHVGACLSKYQPLDSSTWWPASKTYCNTLVPLSGSQMWTTVSLARSAPAEKASSHTTALRLKTEVTFYTKLVHSFWRPVKS